MTLLLKSTVLLCAALLGQGFDIDLNNLVSSCNLPKPWSMSRIRPKFKIYTPSSPSNYAKYVRYNILKSAYGNVWDVVRSVEEVWDTNIKRIIFITHGFGGTIGDSWMHKIKDRILKYNKDQMVVIMGWGNGAYFYSFTAGTDYPRAAANTQSVADQLTDILTNLHARRLRGSGTQFYAIGHSLGAHLMGYAGKFRRVWSRITGLDPAGVCFETTNTNVRLSPDDATYVDIIHSDGNRPSSSSPFFGTLVPLGNIDFYPNWGQQGQPGCYGTGLTACSHSKAYEYFSWSISNPGKFETHRQTGAPTYNSINKRHWNNNAQPAEMGYYSDNNEYTRKGCYYLKTNSEGTEPYISVVPKYFVLVHRQSGKVLIARSSGATQLYGRNPGDKREEWFRDGQLLRNRKYPSKVLDFNTNDYKNEGWGLVHLSSYVHKRDDQRFIPKDSSIVLQWKRKRLVLHVKNNQAIGCYTYNGGSAQIWNIQYVA